MRKKKICACGEKSLPGLDIALCQYHYDARQWGERWADTVRRREIAAEITATTGIHVEAIDASTGPIMHAYVVGFRRIGCADADEARRVAFAEADGFRSLKEGSR